MSDIEQATVVPVTAISAISLKLPLFWPKHPDTHALPKLKHSSLLVGFLSPPVETSYTLLKRELIQRFVGSNQQKLQQLLNELELGESKPSQLLRHMRQLWCGADADGAIILDFRGLLAASPRQQSYGFSTIRLYCHPGQTG